MAIQWFVNHSGKPDRLHVCGDETSNYAYYILLANLNFLCISNGFYIQNGQLNSKSLIRERISKKLNRWLYINLCNTYKQQTHKIKIHYRSAVGYIAINLKILTHFSYYVVTYVSLIPLLFTNILGNYIITDFM